MLTDYFLDLLCYCHFRQISNALLNITEAVSGLINPDAAFHSMLLLPLWLLISGLTPPFEISAELIVMKHNIADGIWWGLGDLKLKKITAELKSLSKLDRYPMYYVYFFVKQNHGLYIPNKIFHFS